LGVTQYRNALLLKVTFTNTAHAISFPSAFDSQETYTIFL